MSVFQGDLGPAGAMGAAGKEGLMGPKVSSCESENKVGGNSNRGIY